MLETNKKEFGGFVASLRKEKGYTQKELAAKLFVSDKAVSKWENGQSMPDIGLLLPLGEELGVSATELLLAKRMESDKLVSGKEVEEIVQTVLLHSDKGLPRAYSMKNPLRYGFVGVFLPSLASVLFMWRKETDVFPLFLTFFILGAVTGAYFLFGVKTKLPAYYDENRIGFYTDGFLRINLVGIRFTNKNWRPIIKFLSIWGIFIMALPVIGCTFTVAAPEFRIPENLRVYLILPILISLFLPLYVIAKKKEL